MHILTKYFVWTLVYFLQYLNNTLVYHRLLCKFQGAIKQTIITILKNSFCGALLLHKTFKMLSWLKISKYQTISVLRSNCARYIMNTLRYIWYHFVMVWHLLPWQGFSIKGGLSFRQSIHTLLQSWQQW